VHQRVHAEEILVWAGVMIALTLPYPISSNRYWRSFVPKGWTRAVVSLSDEAKAYKSHVGWLAKAQGCKVPMTGPIEISLKLVPINRRRIDLSNCWKVAEDALQGIAFGNDSQVVKLTAELVEPDGKGALIVRISEFVPAPAPLFANAA